MKIISRHNKKDFYDYSAFGYDTSEDIVYKRIPELIKIDKKIFDKFVPYTNIRRGEFYIEYMIVGIYPYCYLIPYVGEDTFNSKNPIILPYNIINDIDKVNNFIKEKNFINIELRQPAYLGRYWRESKTLSEKFKNEELFKTIGVPTFIFFNNIRDFSYIIGDKNYGLGQGNIYINPIFNETKLNILKYIQNDLDTRPIYNEIENFLWAIKEEPISEPDNKTKIINHGFDIKTSFRKM